MRDIVAIARSFLGTPYVPCGRVKGLGVDCMGLLICVAREAGWEGEDHLGSVHTDQFARMTEGLAGNSREVPIDEGLPGDAIVFRSPGIGERPARRGAVLNHAGIDCGESFIHAMGPEWPNKVIEQAWDDAWSRRVAKRYRLSS